MLTIIKTLNSYLSGTPTPTPETNSEQESYFLTRLPPEIRIQIYKLIFGHDTIHLLHNKDQVSHIRLPIRSRNRSKECNNPIYAPFAVEKPQISSLLLTCRQIHREAAPLFYSTPVFRVSLQETWNLFSKLIGPENLSHVRSLCAPVHLQTQSTFRVTSSNRSQPKAAPLLWASAAAGSYKDEERKAHDEFCDILATKMSGLKDLMLVLVSLPEGPAQWLEAGWHAPLHRLRGLQRFALEIRNETDAGAEDTKELVKFLRETVCKRRDEDTVHLYK
ncbi:hypothetical protein AJ78_09034 [Emergomyces pasteurianus Ep9510]|uniref:DUF7730 domain-containing protein n=1 Tax=Emergomyces pasteurianus Ep9510 TaxID=1447872 RepID=A0A1J9PZV8_9EURO|nr:hypothetical protein AJ78_09034 [Emergomyces pasteurianus Ep9510]